MDTRTSYLGLELKNPLMVGAGPLTANAESVCRCEDAGAGAVVLKSLFEEQIRRDNEGLDAALEQEENWHTEVGAYREADLALRYGSHEYLEILRASKKRADIPVIASINGTSAESWLQFAKDIEAAGADALELNIALIARDVFTDGATIQTEYENIVRRVGKRISIPFSVKLVPYFSALPWTINRLCSEGAHGFVLFNRLYRPHVDPGSMHIRVDGEDKYSSRKELAPSLRTIAGVAGRVNADFAAATGVHEVEDVLGALLVGASAVQMVTAPLTRGLNVLTEHLQGMKEWMESHEFNDISSFRGRLSEMNSAEGTMFSRTQYVKSIAVPSGSTNR